MLHCCDVFCHLHHLSKTPWSEKTKKLFINAYSSCPFDKYHTSSSESDYIKSIFASFIHIQFINAMTKWFYPPYLRKFCVIHQGSILESGVSRFRDEFAPSFIPHSGDSAWINTSDGVEQSSWNLQHWFLAFEWRPLMLWTCDHYLWFQGNIERAQLSLGWWHKIDHHRCLDTHQVHHIANDSTHAPKPVNKRQLIMILKMSNFPSQLSNRNTKPL